MFEYTVTFMAGYSIPLPIFNLALNPFHKTFVACLPVMLARFCQFVLIFRNKLFFIADGASHGCWSMREERKKSVLLYLYC